MIEKTKGAELDFCHALSFHVSPNTPVERTEENNHPHAAVVYDNRAEFLH